MSHYDFVCTVHLGLNRYDTTISIENSYPWQNHFDQVPKARFFGKKGTVYFPASIKD